MSEITPSSDHVEDERFDPNTPVPISLRLHEAIALAVLYERAPEDLDLWDDGVWWGQSVDLAMLRLAEATSRAVGSKEGLLRAGAMRAKLDQVRSDT